MLKANKSAILTFTLALVCVMLVGGISLQLVPPYVGAADEVQVSIISPNEVVPDTDFTVTVDISDVTELHAVQYDIFFNPDVLRLDDITDGMIGTSVFPVPVTTPTEEIAPREFASGHWRVVTFVETSTFNGTGYLAELHFHAIGALGTGSDINIVDGLLSGINGEISAIWINDHVDIIVLPGDANGNGEVNAVDITKTERIIVGLDDPTPGADANQNGEINAVDITKIERIIVGLD